MRRSRLLLLPVSLLLAAAACTGSVADRRPIVVVIQDGSVPDARQVVSPAVLALDMFLADRGVSTEVRDTGGRADVAMAIATHAADDQRVVAVVVAPFTWVPAGARDRLLMGGLAVVSLSALDEPGAGAWRRIGTTLEDDALAMVHAFAGERPCVAGEPTVASRRLGQEMLAAAGPGLRTVEEPDLAGAAMRLGCTDLAWTGSAPGAIAVRDALARAGVDLAIVLGPAARTDAYLETGWPAGVGTRAICGCADVSLSVEPAAIAFVHRYQAETGLDPGPFAAEGADAVRLILGDPDGLITPTRAGVAARVGETSVLTGVAGTYRWGPDGELRQPVLRTFEVSGVRWVTPP